MYHQKITILIINHYHYITYNIFPSKSTDHPHVVPAALKLYDPEANRGLPRRHPEAERTERTTLDVDIDPPQIQ